MKEFVTRERMKQKVKVKFDIYKGATFYIVTDSFEGDSKDEIICQISRLIQEGNGRLN